MQSERTITKIQECLYKLQTVSASDIVVIHLVEKKVTMAAFSDEGYQSSETSYMSIIQKSNKPALNVFTKLWHLLVLIFLETSEAF